MTTPSIEQQAIIAATRLLPDSLLIEALAGSGKTWSLIEVIKVLREASAIVLAFNTRIADEMGKRMPQVPRGRLVHVKTIHSAGLWITRAHFPHLKVDKNESERLIDKSCSKGTNLRIRGAALKLLRMVKDFQHDTSLNADVAYRLGTEFGLLDKLEGGELQTAIEITQRAYELSRDIDQREAIDYPDMTWLPLVLGLDPPSRYKAVLIDEVQDVSPNQFAMVDLLLAPGGRVIACGDRNQAIYGWRGATPEATWEILQERYKCKTFPLTITWRCDQAIVEQANELVPDLRARDDAGPGLVDSCSIADFYDNIRNPEAEGTVFVLSRTNAALLKIALEMWKQKIGFNITQSPEVVWPLKDIVKKLLRGGPGLHGAAQQAFPMTVFKQALSAWRITETNKANGAGSATWAERIEEQFAMLTHCLGYVTDPENIPRLLDTIFSDDEEVGILLSTVHKVKGQEADRVYLLRETFSRYRKRKNKKGEMALPTPEEVPAEEDNILYVAITRARHELVYVSIEP